MTLQKYKTESPFFSNALFFIRRFMFCFAFLLGANTLNAQANWVEQLGGGETDIGICTAADAFGNIYTIGTFSGTASFGIYNITSAGKADIFLTKANGSDGNVLWVKQVGGGNEDNGNSVVCDPSGNIYFTGRFSGSMVLGAYTLTSNGTSDAFVAKIDNGTGFISWVKQIGGSGNDCGLSITSDDAGNIFASGYFQGIASFDTFTLSPVGSNHNIFIARIDAPTGNIVWAKGYGGSGYSYGNALSCDASGAVYLTGNFESSVTFGSVALTSVQYQDIFISKHFGTTGNVVWAVSMGGMGNDNGNGLTVNTDGNIYCTGKFEGVCSFGTTTLTSAGNADIFISKTNALTGMHDWVEQYGDEGHEQANSIAHDASGSLFITGQFNGYVTFGNHLINSSGNSDGFIVKLDGAGNPTWATSLGGIFIDSGYGISTDNNGGLYCTGVFQSNAYLAGPVYSSKGSSDAFVIKLMSATVGIDEKDLLNNSLKVMPIPFTDELTIFINKNDFTSHTITLTDISGKEILNIKSNEDHQQLNLEYLNPGIYFLTLTTANGERAVRKIVKR